MQVFPSTGRHRVLHIGGTAADARLIRDCLSDSTADRYEVERVESLQDAQLWLAANPTSVVLLDARLAGGPATEGVRQLLASAPGLPILVVGAEDQKTAHQVLHAGACDYLVTSHIDSYWLPHAIQLAIDRKVSDVAVFAETERVEMRLNSHGDALLSTDVAGRVTYLNRAAEAMTGWSRVAAAGLALDRVLRLVDSTTRDFREDPSDLAVPRELAAQVVSNWILIRPDGSESAIERSTSPLRDALGQVTGTAIVLRDVSAARAVSLRMSHLASHDPLTDLPNRLLLGDRLARALALAQRHQRRLAVLFLDIDRFKHINDSLGHPLGDELLRAVGRQLTTCVRSSDTVSRHGGDEFVVVLSELQRAADAAVGAQKIIDALIQPLNLAGHELHITASIGISVYPDDGADADTLLRRADMALYHAKNQGRDRYHFFEAALNMRAVERQSIEAGLHVALEKRQFELYYQPKVSLKTGGVIGAEALIRWRHPDRGLIEAGQFVPVAEDCGLIMPIGRWVVHEACRQARAWQDAGLRPIPVAVNISAVESRSNGFLDNISETLRATRLDPRFLEIELTESALMAQAGTTNEVLSALKVLGVQLAIDDFGTGWSSLSYLKRFPIDTLKVDKSFLQEITAGVSAAPIVRAVIHMGKSLNLRIVAEGVETRDQLAFLQAEECDAAQGYHFSRPLVAEQFARVLETGIDRVVGAVEAGGPGKALWVWR